MSLFPLDAVRNAQIDRRLEPPLEDLRRHILEADFTGPFSADDVVEAFQASRPRLNVMLSLIQHVRGHVLDVSTGLGFLALALSRLDVPVTATEHDLTVPELLPVQGIPVVPYTIGSGTVPCPAGSFDVAVLGEVLEHLKVPPVRAVSEVASLVRPGGYLLVTTPNIARLAHLEALASGENFLEAFSEEVPLGDDPTDYVEHVREYSIREVVDAVEAAGLIVQRVLMTGWGEAGYDLAPNPYANDIIVLWAQVPAEE